MKFIVSIVFLCSLGIKALALDSVSLYAQGCLPYVEQDSYYFNCDQEESINILLKDVSPDFQKGSWSKTIRIGASKFIVSIDLQKINTQNGEIIELITGQIDEDTSVSLVTATDSLTAETSVSLGSLLPYGDKGGFPHFFFGRSSKLNIKKSEVIMRNALSRAR